MNLRYDVGDWIEVIFNDKSREHIFGYILVNQKKHLELAETDAKKIRNFSKPRTKIRKKIINTIIIE